MHGMKRFKFDEKQWMEVYSVQITATKKLEMSSMVLLSLKKNYAMS